MFLGEIISEICPGAKSMSDDEHLKSEVPIFVNNVKYEIKKGPELVSNIKKIGKVPVADELEELIEGKLNPLPDSGSVEIKGGEHFVSHPRTGKSSSN